MRVGEEEIPNFEGWEGTDVGAGASSRRYRRASSEGIARGGVFCRAFYRRIVACRTSYRDIVITP